MKTPHEQEWKQGKNNWSIRDTEGDRLRAQVYTDDQTASEADDVARFIAAAPDMARALLEARHQLALQMDGDPEWHKRNRVEKVAAVIDAALRKAGCLP